MKLRLKTVPVPPKLPDPPLIRYVSNNGVGFCDKCHSSLYPPRFLFGKNLGCMQPKCSNHQGVQKTGIDLPTLVFYVVSCMLIVMPLLLAFNQTK